MGFAYMIGGFIGAPILNRVAYLVGKRNGIIVAALIGMLGYGGSWYLYNPSHPWLQVSPPAVEYFSRYRTDALGSIGADVMT